MRIKFIKKHFWGFIELIKKLLRPKKERRQLVLVPHRNKMIFQGRTTI